MFTVKMNVRVFRETMCVRVFTDNTCEGVHR